MDASDYNFRSLVSLLSFLPHLSPSLLRLRIPSYTHSFIYPPPLRPKMHSVALISSLFSLLALTNAQAGRFPCTTVIAGLPTLDQSLCVTLTPTGLDQGVSHPTFPLFSPTLLLRFSPALLTRFLSLLGYPDGFQGRCQQRFTFSPTMGD